MCSTASGSSCLSVASIPWWWRSWNFICLTGGVMRRICRSRPVGTTVSCVKNTVRCIRWTDWTAVLRSWTISRRLARLQGSPTEGAVAESAPGQFEINLVHSENVLEACDRALQLKRLVRRVAEKYRLTATLMAKLYEASMKPGPVAVCISTSVYGMPRATMALSARMGARRR